MNNITYNNWLEEEDERVSLLTMIEINEYISENIIKIEDLLNKLNLSFSEIENLRNGDGKVNLNILKGIEEFYDRKFFVALNSSLRDLSLESFDNLINLENDTIPKSKKVIKKPTLKNI
jgi:transcriptional regulator with XRE-family HTH domain